MKNKKWIVIVLSVLLCAFLAWAALNVLLDPFNAFGDPVMKWDSYTQTLNPRNSKVAYVTARFDEYDSYVIGSSNAASFLPQTLNKYFDDASFYNMFHYDTDLQYDKELTKYLVEHDDVKNIVLVIEPDEALADTVKENSISDNTHYKVSGENALSYYVRHLFADPRYAAEKIKSHNNDTEMRQEFDAVDSEHGTYDRRMDEIESIGELSEYLEKHSADFTVDAVKRTLDNIDGLVENVREIRKICDDAGAKLTVVIPPMYELQVGVYTEDSLNELFEGLASVTDYWNFSVSAVSSDARYFYDALHARNETVNMALARMFEDSEAYYPEAFGVLCSKGDTVTLEELNNAVAENADKAYTKVVPVLLYHNFVEEPADSPTGSETFRRQMELLRTNGYEVISLNELIDFVEKGTPLPEKPVVITFDDGYLSNYEIAYPILREYGFEGTIFTIGCSFGHKKYYKDTELEMTPHFDREEMDEMLASGIITIGSHTYDMHQVYPYDSGEYIRESIVPFENEGEEEYIKALSADIERQNALFESVGLAPADILAFPHGEYDDLANAVLRSYGYKLTLSTDATRCNTIVAGLPQSLINVGRITLDGGISDEDLLAYLNHGNN